MQYMYGRANGNGRAALRRSVRRMPDHRIFQWLHLQVHETLSFHATRRVRAVRSLSLEESILNVVADRLESSTKATAHHLSVSHYSVCRVLNENRLHLFQFQ
ncbi:hypothetical protein TNCV_450631 [Trichonephila clavipes]|nr:hypothetical protein TNCV_450631 [Trichonephila clavipes]